MGIVGICAKLFPDIRILTFELMSNHIHILVAAKQERLLQFFETMKKYLRRNMSAKGKEIRWKDFVAGLRRVDSLDYARNVLIYDNRNGYLVSDVYTPYTYPWGANKYFFACDMKRLAQSLAVKMLYKDRRSITHSHEADDIEDLQLFDGYALPLSFCDIAAGESLFRDPIHYFERLSKSIEQNVSIADELKESIQPFTDSELFSAIVGICKIKYGQPRPSLLPPDAKLKMAATMHYDYHAKEKQICRFLNLTPEMVRSVIRF